MWINFEFYSQKRAADLTDMRHVLQDMEDLVDPILGAFPAKWPSRN